MQEGNDSTLEKYEGKNISNEMIKRIPSKDIAVLVAMNFQPGGLKEFIRIMGLEGFANMGAGFLGFTIDDFIKAIKGDILLSVSEITRDTFGKPFPVILFSSSIADKASFEKLINAGKRSAKKNLVIVLHLYFIILPVNILPSEIINK